MTKLNGHNARTWRRRKVRYLKNFHSDVGRGSYSRKLANKRARAAGRVTV
jgi:hypothetical protein